MSMKSSDSFDVFKLLEPSAHPFLYRLRELLVLLTREAYCYLFFLAAKSFVR